jgi:hypothetical protein
MNTAEVIAAIDTMDSDDLGLVLDAYKARMKYVREASSRQAAATIKVGDKIRLSGLRPKYLNGLTGVVVSRNGDKFSVAFDDESKWASGRYGDQVTVPAATLTVIP